MDYIRGRDRNQSCLFPERFDDLIPAEHIVRVIDAFVEYLDVGELGFSKSEPKDQGRPPYHPGDMLKLYLYGYMQRIRASRALERESQRNIEVMWLVNRLSPSFKTIADFRKDEGEGIARACAEFVLFCRSQGLLKGDRVAIDGSKFGADNAVDRNYTASGVKEELSRTRARVERYLEEMDEADAEGEEREQWEEHPEGIAEIVERLKAKQSRLEAIEAHLQATGESQYSATDADARRMKGGRGGWVVGYNVQTAVDAEHYLIVHHTVTNAGNDRNELESMAKGARAALGVDSLEVLADGGYSNGAQVHECEQAGITVSAPREAGSSGQAGHYSRDRFEYDAERDGYWCPAGDFLGYRGSNKTRHGHLYRAKGCGGCDLKPRCTDAGQRTITRHWYEDSLAAMEARVKADPSLMKQRMATAEHPFGTLKSMMGVPRFLTRGLRSVATEMSLSVLAYNLKRATNAFGAGTLIAKMA